MPAFLAAALIVGLGQAPVHDPQQPPPFPLPSDLRVERDVVYGKGGGRDLKLDVYRLREGPTGARPAVIFIHGGGWRAGNKFPPSPVVFELARKGFVSLSIEYRLIPEVRFPGMVEDCKCAVRWLRAHAKEFGVDPNRIGVWGTSAGGHLAAMLGASGGVRELEGSGGWEKESSRVQAVVSCFGPTNLLSILPQRGARGRPNAEEGLVGGAPERLKDVAAKASPVTYVTKDDPPFLFLHGESDNLVPPAQSQEMHDLLVEAGVPSQIKVFPGVGHNLNPEGRQMVVDFFVKQLKP